MAESAPRADDYLSASLECQVGYRMHNAFWQAKSLQHDPTQRAIQHNHSLISLQNAPQMDANVPLEHLLFVQVNKLEATKATSAAQCTGLKRFVFVEQGGRVQ